MKRSLKLIRNSTVSMLTPQQFGICECSIVAGRQHNHDWRKRGIDQQILIWPMEKRTYGAARSLVNFVPPGCFLCSFVSRECNAFLSFTFSRGKILLILQTKLRCHVLWSRFLRTFPLSHQEGSFDYSCPPLSPGCSQTLSGRLNWMAPDPVYILGVFPHAGRAGCSVHASSKEMVHVQGGREWTTWDFIIPLRTTYN